MVQAAASSEKNPLISRIVLFSCSSNRPRLEQCTIRRESAPEEIDDQLSIGAQFFDPFAMEAAMESNAIAQWAHDIRNTLGTVALYLESLERHYQSDTVSLEKPACKLRRLA
jgi:hypothetical protein